MNAETLLRYFWFATNRFYSITVGPQDIIQKKATNIGVITRLELFDINFTYYGCYARYEVGI